MSAQPWMRALGIEEVTESILNDRVLDADLEHTIHELCHAHLLGLEPEYPLSENVSACLQSMTPTARIENEHRAWMAESWVLRMLGYQVCRREISDAGEIQGCSTRLAIDLIVLDLEVAFTAAAVLAVLALNGCMPAETMGELLEWSIA